MQKSGSKKQDELGWLKWVLLIGALLYGIFELIAWPFRSVVRHWPGRRERLLHEEGARLLKSVPTAQQLVQVLGAGVPDIEAKLGNKIKKMEKKLDRLVAEKGWAEDLHDEDPWSMAIEILESAKRIGGVDWTSDTDELKEAMVPLLKRHSLSFDWAFLKDLERQGQYESLKIRNLLPIVATHLSATGHVLAHVDEGSENYLFALCTAEEFSRIDSLANGSYAIRRFDHAR